MFKRRFSLLLLAPAVMAASVHAQKPKPPYDLANDPTPKPSSSYSEQELEKMVPPARPEDVASPEAIVRALHEAVSGPKGEWNPDRFRSLFIPNIVFSYDDLGKDGTLRIDTITLPELVEEVQRLHRQTAWEERVIDVPTLIKTKREHQVTLATVFATVVEGVPPFSDTNDPSTAPTTVMHIGKRWWIVGHTW